MKAKKDSGFLTGARGELAELLKKEFIKASNAFPFGIFEINNDMEVSFHADQLELVLTLIRGTKKTRYLHKQLLFFSRICARNKCAQLNEFIFFSDFPHMTGLFRFWSIYSM